MASSKRKTVIVDQSSSDDELSFTNINEDNDNENEFKADFDFFDPNENDSEEIEVLLKNGLFGNSKMLNLNTISNVISNQGNIGTSLKTSLDSSNSIVAIFSILNLYQYYELNLLREEIIELVKDHSTKKEKFNFDEVFSKKENCIGLVINERFINLPSKLIPQLYESLFEDTRWSQETPDMPLEERPFYFFSHLLFYTTYYYDDTQKTKKKPKHSITQQNQEDDFIFYKKFEDVEFIKEAVFKITWPTNKIARLSTFSEDIHKNNLKSYSEHKMIYIIPYDKFWKAIIRLKKSENL